MDTTIALGPQELKLVVYTVKDMQVYIFSGILTVHIYYDMTFLLLEVLGKIADLEPLEFLQYL